MTRERWVLCTNTEYTFIVCSNERVIVMYGNVTCSAVTRWAENFQQMWHTLTARSNTFLEFEIKRYSLVKEHLTADKEDIKAI